MPIENQSIPAPTTPTPPKDDLPLAITRAVEAVEQAATPPSTPAKPSPSSEASTPPSPAQGDEGGGTRPRGPDGKFVPKAPTDAGAAPPAAPTDAGAAPPAAPSPTDNAPASWKAELKEKWATLDPEVRSEIARREQEINHGMQASARRAQAAAAVLAEFEPYAEIMQAENISPVTAMRDLLGTVYALRSSGPEYRKAIFLQLAQQYGVDLTTGINSAQARAEAEATQADIYMRSQNAHQEAQQVEYARSVLTQFAQSPGHEHFPQVAEIMGNLMATGVCGDLETAYQQACALHPNLRPVLIRQEAERIAQQQQAEARARAAAAGSVGNSPGAASVGTPPPSSGNQALRASLEAAFERATR